MLNQKRMPKSIGWKEWLALPELGVPAIKVKVDTGAKTSALHAFKLEFFTRDDREFVRFWLHPLQKNTEVEIVCEAPVADRRIIRDSGGHEEERSVIETPILINGKQWLIEISLASRENMSFRMLLGRSAMRRGGVLVNPNRAYLTGKRLKKVYAKACKPTKKRSRVEP